MDDAPRVFIHLQASIWTSRKLWSIILVQESVPPRHKVPRDFTFRQGHRCQFSSHGRFGSQGRSRHQPRLAPRQQHFLQQRIYYEHAWILLTRTMGIGLVSSRRRGMLLPARDTLLGSLARDCPSPRAFATGNSRALSAWSIAQEWSGRGPSGRLFGAPPTQSTPTSIGADECVARDSGTAVSEQQQQQCY